MRNSKLTFYSLINALGVLVYTSLVATLVFNGQRLFGDGKKVLIPIAMLMLLVLSAAIVGLLVFGRPVLWYMEGKKIEGIKLLFCTIGWLAIMTLTAFVVLAMMK